MRGDCTSDGRLLADEHALQNAWIREAQGTRNSRVALVQRDSLERRGKGMQGMPDFIHSEVLRLEKGCAAG